MKHEALNDLQSYFIIRSMLEDTQAVSTITWLVASKLYEGLIPEWGTLAILHPNDLYRQDNELDAEYQRLVIKEHEWCLIKTNTEKDKNCSVGKQTWATVDMCLPLINKELEEPNENRKIWTISDRPVMNSTLAKIQGINYLSQGAVDMQERYGTAHVSLNKFVKDFIKWLKKKRPTTFKSIGGRLDASN